MYAVAVGEARLTVVIPVVCTRAFCPDPANTPMMILAAFAPHCETVFDAERQARLPVVVVAPEVRLTPVPPGSASPASTGASAFGAPPVKKSPNPSADGAHALINAPPVVFVDGGVTELPEGAEVNVAFAVGAHTARPSKIWLERVQIEAAGTDSVSDPAVVLA